MTDREPTDTTLADIMKGDQHAAEIEDTAGMVGRYYERLVGAGMSAEAAESGAAEYQSLLLAQRFMDVHQKLGIGIMLGEE